LLELLLLPPLLLPPPPPPDETTTNGVGVSMMGVKVGILRGTVVGVKVSVGVGICAFTVRATAVPILFWAWTVEATDVSTSAAI
jgi:hypothetical protein